MENSEDKQELLLHYYNGPCPDWTRCLESDEYENQWEIKEQLVCEYDWFINFNYKYTVVIMEQ